MLKIKDIRYGYGNIGSAFGLPTLAVFVENNEDTYSKDITKDGDEVLTPAIAEKAAAEFYKEFKDEISLKGFTKQFDEVLSANLALTIVGSAVADQDCAKVLYYFETLYERDSVEKQKELYKTSKMTKSMRPPYKMWFGVPKNYSGLVQIFNAFNNVGAVLPLKGITSFEELRKVVSVNGLTEVINGIFANETFIIDDAEDFKNIEVYEKANLTPAKKEHIFIYDNTPGHTLKDAVLDKGYRYLEYNESDNFIFKASDF